MSRNGRVILAVPWGQTAAIDADDAQSPLDVLGEDPQLVIEHRGHEIVIRAREASAH